MNAFLLEEFLTDECDEYTVKLLLKEIKKIKVNKRKGEKKLEFNRFIVSLNINFSLVIIEDVMNLEDSGVYQMQLSDFESRLKAF